MVTVKFYNTNPVVTFYTDYYPFGYPMSNRNWSGTDYRFGFNGQEKDDEIYEEGKSYSFEFRNYDARLGRFWSVDPIAAQYPWNIPYAFAENRVIDGIELEGLEYWPSMARRAMGMDNYVNMQTKSAEVAIETATIVIYLPQQ